MEASCLFRRRARKLNLKEKPYRFYSAGGSRKLNQEETPGWFIKLEEEKTRLTATP